MLDALKTKQKEPSTATLESNMQFGPQIKPSNRFQEFTKRGLMCPECHYNECDVIASTYSRDILYFRCSRCSATW